MHIETWTQTQNATNNIMGRDNHGHVSFMKMKPIEIYQKTASANGVNFRTKGAQTLK